MISCSYTGVEPMAVMVKSVNTLVADEAMPRVRSSQDFTLWANVTGVKVLVQLQERHFA
jgi:hypothetical protein